MSVTLDTKPQIAMWVMLSRRHQVQMHLRGLKQKGIIAALKRDFGDHGNRVVNYVLPIENAIAFAGGEPNYKIVNAHVLRILGNGMLRDMGVYNDPDDAVIANPGILDLYANGGIEMVLTLDPVREANNEIYVPA